MHFKDSFWTPDYAGGLGQLFKKLDQGVAENESVISLAKDRADAEEAYGRRLIDISKRSSRGFDDDEGATTKKAFDGIKSEFLDISKNLYEMAIRPFGSWARDHASRVHASHDILLGEVKTHDKALAEVSRLKTQYLNSARLKDEWAEEQEKKKTNASENNADDEDNQWKVHTVPSMDAGESDAEPIELGETLYQIKEMGELLQAMLTKIPRNNIKVPIIGVYTNTSKGSDIVAFIQKEMAAQSLEAAEKIGQDLVNNGLLRLVGNVGRSFANSSVMSYQWRRKAFLISGVKDGGEQTRQAIIQSAKSVPYVGDYLGGFVGNNLNARPGESHQQRLDREAKESDASYKSAVKQLDERRSKLEETMMDHFDLMEQCELDRLKAIKTVLHDISVAVSGVIPALQKSVEQVRLFQETMKPETDLNYLLENYRTGFYSPKVITYENESLNIDDQVFGIDLDVRARQDGKRVPNIISQSLTFLDLHYVELEDDQARQAVWLEKVPLRTLNALRATLNSGEKITKNSFGQSDASAVASVLILYLLQLPDSVIGFANYDTVKSIYHKHGNDEDIDARIKEIQEMLIHQTKISNVATLDALCSHFARLINLTSADDKYVADLSQVLSPAILRPKTQSLLTLGERHSVRLLQDLLHHKDRIFADVKKATSQRKTSLGIDRNETIQSPSTSRFTSATFPGESQPPVPEIKIDAEEELPAAPTIPATKPPSTGRSYFSRRTANKEPSKAKTEEKVSLSDTPSQVE